MTLVNQASARAARTTLLLAALLVLIVAFAAGPASAQRHTARSFSDGLSYSMSWSSMLFVPFSKASSPPGLRSPSIDGSLVACTTGKAAAVPGGSPGLDIRYRTLGARGALWGGPGDQLQPAVAAGLIAGLDEGLIKVFDPATRTAVTVSDAAALYPFAPAFSGSLVAWEDHRNGFTDIYARAFDRATGQPIGDAFAVCTASGHQTEPAIDGDVIVWQDARDGSLDIYAYDLSEKREFPVCSAPGDQCHPDVSGDVIVWQDSRRGQWDIYGYDLAAGEELPICLERSAQTRPAVSGDVVVWQSTQLRRYQNDDEPVRSSETPLVHAYLIKARQTLGEVWGGNPDSRETRADVSASTVVYQDDTRQADGVTRISGVKISGVWAYGYAISPSEWYVREPALTFRVRVDVCPSPPVTQVGIGISTSPRPDDSMQWLPFAPETTVQLPAPDGMKYWALSLRDSGGADPGSGGSTVVLDTHGPSCWTPYPLSARSGTSAVLRYKVTDMLSPRARALVEITRADGSVVSTLPARWVKTGTLLERRLDCDLLPGSYLVRVTASDLAGNPQRRTGTTRLIIR